MKVSLIPISYYILTFTLKSVVCRTFSVFIFICLVVIDADGQPSVMPKLVN